jgi:branched-chain amino acid transport system substrate-binding protein
MKSLTRRTVLAAVPSFLALGCVSARAAKQYGVGATSTEIKIGNTVPYSGPASSYGTIGKAAAAYYKMINDQGGVNGRKIHFISYDDGYNPLKATEMVHRLVERDQVLLCAATFGNPVNAAIWQYMNEMKVPQLFVLSRQTEWNDPQSHPWTMGWQPSYQCEGRSYAAYIVTEKPDAKIGILYQKGVQLSVFYQEKSGGKFNKKMSGNSPIVEFGLEYLKGIKEGLGDKAQSMILLEAPYSFPEPTVKSQLASMKAAGCNVLINLASAKFAVDAIRGVAEIGWKPLHILSGIGNSVAVTLKPAGLENAKEIKSNFYLKDPGDEQWKEDADYKEWVAFMNKYYPEGDKSDISNIYGASNAATVVQVLKQCGDELTRENVMRQAANLHEFAAPMLLPGIKINTTPSDFAPIKEVRMGRFDGTQWRLFGPLIAGGVK